MSVDVERIALNQALMRVVNDNVRFVSETFGLSDDTITIFCECGNVCDTRLTVALSDYQRMRLDPMHFLIVPDHLMEEVDRPLERHDDWLLVEAHGVAAEVVRRERAKP